MVARELRLRSPIEFERARARGKSWTSELVVAVVLPNDRETNRYGFAVGRRVGKAVTRNRAKRLMREATRNLHPRLVQGHDIVFIARNRVGLETSLSAIAAAMERVLRQAGLLGEDVPAGVDRGTGSSSEV